VNDPERRPTRSRLLSAGEVELWMAVTADVRPFRERPARPVETARPKAGGEARPIGAGLANAGAKYSRC